MRHLYLATQIVLLLGLTSCSDPSGVLYESGELSGTIRPGADRAALILQVEPTRALDSLFVGPPKDRPKGLTVAGPISGRYLIISEETLAEGLRFRAFVNRAVDPMDVRFEIIETARKSGDIDNGESARVTLTR